jgi:hypothetical protein
MMLILPMLSPFALLVLQEQTSHEMSLITDHQPMPKDIAFILYFLIYGRLFLYKVQSFGLFTKTSSAYLQSPS